MVVTKIDLFSSTYLTFLAFIQDFYQISTHKLGEEETFKIQFCTITMHFLTGIQSYNVVKRKFEEHVQIYYHIYSAIDGQTISWTKYFKFPR